MLDAECPIHIVDRAAELASELELGPIPLDFDPGKRLWREIVALIAQEFSNHEELLGRLDEVGTTTAGELCEHCRVLHEAGKGDATDCPERWLAEHELWAAALSAAERGYQRWLARRAIRRMAAEGS